jgi:hypothetical protein
MFMCESAERSRKLMVARAIRSRLLTGVYLPPVTIRSRSEFPHMP